MLDLFIFGGKENAIGEDRGDESVLWEKWPNNTNKLEKGHLKHYRRINIATTNIFIILTMAPRRSTPRRSNSNSAPPAPAYKKYKKGQFIEVSK